MSRACSQLRTAADAVLDEASDPAKHARVTYDIAEAGGVVRLTVTDDSAVQGAEAAEAWPMILAGLKSLLETGQALPPFWAREGGSWRKLHASRRRARKTRDGGPASV